MNVLKKVFRGKEVVRRYAGRTAVHIGEGGATTEKESVSVESRRGRKEEIQEKNGVIGEF